MLLQHISIIISLPKRATVWWK